MHYDDENIKILRKISYCSINVLTFCYAELKMVFINNARNNNAN